MRSFTLSILALTLALSSPLYAEAQGIPGVESLTLTLSPTYPRPYERVTVTVGSTLVELASSDITISANGTIIGEGGRSASFMSGGAGTKTELQAVVVSSEGTFTKEMTVWPADVALVLEPDSTAHPFYDGARLVAPEGQVRLIALPDFRTAPGTKIAPEKLSYTWRFGDKILNDYSGIGKNVLPATAPVRYRDARITVTVTTQDRALVAEASRMISAGTPLVRIYRNDPLEGIAFSHALSSFSLAGTEETFRMVPYFFRSDPSLSWSLNGTKSSASANLTLRTTGNEAGTASIRASATEPATIPQTAEAGLTVQFGRAASTGIFGL